MARQRIDHSAIPMWGRFDALGAGAGAGGLAFALIAVLFGFSRSYPILGLTIVGMGVVSLVIGLVVRLSSRR